MSPGRFIPLDDGRRGSPTPQFVRHGSTKLEDGSDSSNPAPVTPAEAHDIKTQLRQVLQDQITEDSLDSIIGSIQAIVQNTPARVALPEIKLHPLDAPSEGQPTIAFDREGDTVKSVQVNCSCGQSIHLDCIY